MVIGTAHWYRSGSRPDQRDEPERHQAAARSAASVGGLIWVAVRPDRRLEIGVPELLPDEAHGCAGRHRRASISAAL
jgi:hypothetical protein